MYFSNERKNTNIDKEFKNYNLSKIIDILNKHKLLIFVVIGVLIIILSILIFINRKVVNYLVLNGEEIITIYQNSDYADPGYQAYNSKNEDLTNKVTIISTLDTDKIGEYEITYTLGDITKTRKINVIKKPKEYTYIYLKTVDNDINIYLKVGEKYKEPGYEVYNSSGKKLTNNVEITGTVDTSKKGNYELIYSVVDSNNVTISASRTIIVMDTEISLSLSTEEYTNRDITINIGVIDNYYDYMILPNNTKITQKSYSYKVSENGKYTFKVYNKRGNLKESSIEIKNIDKISPTGSCSGIYENGKTTITITANDNVGISKYIVNGTSYTTNIITINNSQKSANITIYDKAGNTKNISCSVENKEPITSDKSITFSYEYINTSGYMRYALYTPSSANNNAKTPLIIWLHGQGEVGMQASGFKNSGMLAVLNNWKLHGFNAYVLCPQLTSGNWINETARKNLNNLVNKIIKEKNIDTDKIIITGHSLGGEGALYMAAKNDYYSALVVYSGYYPNTSIKGIKIPALGYIGTAGAGEAIPSINQMQTHFAGHFGADKLITLNVSHGEVPRAALTQDKNNDNKSDLIEWMLTQ